MIDIPGCSERTNFKTLCNVFLNLFIGELRKSHGMLFHIFGPVLEKELFSLFKHECFTQKLTFEENLVGLF
jgi:hypothetical protein